MDAAWLEGYRKTLSCPSVPATIQDQAARFVMVGCEYLDRKKSLEEQRNRPVTAGELLDVLEHLETLLIQENEVAERVRLLPPAVRLEIAHWRSSEQGLDPDGLV